MRGLSTSLDSGYLDSSEVAVYSSSPTCSRPFRRPRKPSGFGVDWQVSSLLQLSPSSPSQESPDFGRALASCSSGEHGPSDGPRSFSALGAGPQVQASGCLRNPRGFCRLLHHGNDCSRRLFRRASIFSTRRRSVPRRAVRPRQNQPVAGAKECPPHLCRDHWGTAAGQRNVGLRGARQQVHQAGESAGSEALQPRPSGGSGCGR